MHAGDPLFAIDPRPFQIRLDQANAQLQTAQAKEVLSAAELWRAQTLKRTDYGSLETVDTRAADERSAQAAIQTAKSAIMDAQLDLEFAKVTAPFAGRMGARLVSLGSLVSGSRGGTGQSTLLATVVSLDPIYLNFDMSEADYADYQKARLPGGPTSGVWRSACMATGISTGTGRSTSSTMRWTGAAAPSAPVPPCPIRIWRSRRVSSPACA